MQARYCAGISDCTRHQNSRIYVHIWLVGYTLSPLLNRSCIAAVYLGSNTVWDSTAVPIHITNRPPWQTPNVWYHEITTYWPHRVTNIYNTVTICQSCTMTSEQTKSKKIRFSTLEGPCYFVAVNIQSRLSKTGGRSQYDILIMHLYSKITKVFPTAKSKAARNAIVLMEHGGPN